MLIVNNKSKFNVSTHSRPKAAGSGVLLVMFHLNVSTHSRPKAAGIFSARFIFRSVVSTHSRPKAAGFLLLLVNKVTDSFNTQPPEGGWLIYHSVSDAMSMFQHTAARRRLEKERLKKALEDEFQHTAARRRLVVICSFDIAKALFQHTAARRRLGY